MLQLHGVMAMLERLQPLWSPTGGQYCNVDKHVHACDPKVPVLITTAVCCASVLNAIWL